MKKLIVFLFLLTFPLSAMPRVLVSVAPQKFLINRIAQDRVEVEVIVPDGVSPHSYEPTPRQSLGLQKSCIWFRVGETFEKRLVPVLSKKMDIIDQRDGVDLLPTCGCCHDIDGYDSHIWLSPDILKQLSSQITVTLSEKFPESALFFQANCALLHADLQALDQILEAQLTQAASKTLLVTHPAFGYFCRDYGLIQLSIEQEGKEPTAKQLIEILKDAKEASVSCVLLQRQYNQKGGERIAKALGVKTHIVDPYREDVLDNLREIAQIL
jgi:zinc transport system substrate-binding protein